MILDAIAQGHGGNRAEVEDGCFLCGTDRIGINGPNDAFRRVGHRCGHALAAGFDGIEVDGLAVGRLYRSVQLGLN